MSDILSATDCVHYNAVDQLFSLGRHNRYKDVPTKLEEFGFDIDVENAHGNTLLCVASQNGLKRMAKLALRMGADIDHQNGMGNTPLHFCCAYGFAELASYLISKGADPMIQNHNGVLCTEGLGKDALRLVNQAITDAQEAGLLDDYIPQHVESHNNTNKIEVEQEWNNNIDTAAAVQVQDEEQYYQQEETSTQQPYYQDYQEHDATAEQQAYYQEAVLETIPQPHPVKPSPPLVDDVFGVATWGDGTHSMTSSSSYSSTTSKLSKTSSMSSLSSTSSGRWRPLPKAPKPRPLPKVPRPLPKGTKPSKIPQRKKILIVDGNKKTTITTTTTNNNNNNNKKKNRKQNDDAVVLPALQKMPVSYSKTETVPPPNHNVQQTATPRTLHGYKSILQAVHADDTHAVRGLTGHTSQQDVDAALHACGLAGSNTILEILMPHATAKSMDRAMIAATARSHHHVVEFMLSQKSSTVESGERIKQQHSMDTDKGDDAGAGASGTTRIKVGQVSQSGIDRALVRAASVVPKTEKEWESMTDAERERRRGTNHSNAVPNSSSNSDSSFRALLNMSTTPAIDRAFCSVASSGSGLSKASLLLPWVSVRGRRSGLLASATTGNWSVLQLVLGSMLEAEIDSVSKEKDNVRARLRQEARFSTLARGLEAAASRGHGQCCELLWECCGDEAKKRSIAAGSLNGHVDLVSTMKKWKVEELQQYQ